jgi:hypothetical protein
MNINTVILFGILIAVAAPGGYYIYKDVERQQCLEGLSLPHHPDDAKAYAGHCINLGATEHQINYARALSAEEYKFELHRLQNNPNRQFKLGRLPKEQTYDQIAEQIYKEVGIEVNDAASPQNQSKNQ